MDDNAEEAGCALKHTLVWLKNLHVLNTDMKRPFSHVFSLHVHTFSKEISTALQTESALCCWQCHQDHWSASHLTIQPADQCALSTAFTSGALSGAGTPLPFSSACYPNRSSLLSAEGSRGSVVFLVSQSSILLAFSQFPLNSIIQHKVENLLLRVKSKACDECNCSWKHPSLGVSLC